MRSYSHLSEDERDQIGVLRAGGRSMGAIARALGRAKATISRELQRNALPSGGRSPLHAAGACQLRRRREAILEREAALRLFSHGLHGSRSPRGSQGKVPQKPSQRCSRCSAVSILICEDQSLSTTTPPSPSTPCSGSCAI